MLFQIYFKCAKKLRKQQKHYLAISGSVFIDFAVTIYKILIFLQILITPDFPLNMIV